jgi:tRNA U38,U39,U40 pseudouridine synthase TruA
VGAGEAKLSGADLQALLASGVRTARIETAPPQGLFLRRVSYR